MSTVFYIIGFVAVPVFAVFFGMREFKEATREMTETKKEEVEKYIEKNKEVFVL